MKQYISILLLLVSFLGVRAQNTDLRKIIDGIIVKLGNNPDNPLENGVPMESKFLKSLILLRNQEEQERTFKGKINFGFNGLEVSNSNQYTISTGIDLSLGTFPSEFNFNANIQAQTINSVFKETVSKISMSYDYHFDGKYPLNRESYVFINRTNNNLLGIDQRYELGGGIIFNNYSGRVKRGERDLDEFGWDDLIIQKKLDGRITQKGKKELKKLLELSNHSNGIDTFDSCLTELCQNDKVITQVEKDKITNSKKRFQRITRKNYSRHRLSLLLGANFELERTTETLPIYNRQQSDTVSFDPTAIYRVVIRPGYQIQTDNFSFSFKPYFKLGILGDLQNETQNESNSLIDEEIDFWIETIARITYKFSEKINLSIRHNYFYDNAPNRMFIALENGQERLFKAEQTFSNLVFEFVYKL